MIVSTLSLKLSARLRDRRTEFDSAVGKSKNEIRGFDARTSAQTRTQESSQQAANCCAILRPR